MSEIIHTVTVEMVNKAPTSLYCQGTSESLFWREGVNFQDFSFEMKRGNMLFIANFNQRSIKEINY